MNQLVRTSFCVLFSASVIAACHNGNSTAAGDTVSNKGASNAASSGNASWSANIDGQDVTGKGVDGLQLLNTAFIYPAQGDKDKYILFDLHSVKTGDDFCGFRFYCPDKEGDFAVEDAKKNGYRCSVRLGFDFKSVDNFGIYYADSVKVVIGSISSTSMSGTFSGEFKLSDLSRSKPYKNRVLVTNGKFDIPFSTGNLRPE
jgi:hypothetical protein